MSEGIVDTLPSLDVDATQASAQASGSELTAIALELLEAHGGSQEAAHERLRRPSSRTPT